MKHKIAIKSFITKKYNNNNFSYDEDPWFANLSNQQIDLEIQDFLRLGHNFYNPNFATKNQQTYEAIKDVENNIYKIPEENREEFRNIFIHSTKQYLSHRIHPTDISISKKFE